MSSMDAGRIQESSRRREEADFPSNSSSANKFYARYFFKDFLKKGGPPAYSVRNVMMTEVDEFMRTSETLLTRVRDLDDHTSWREFFDTYWKLINNRSEEHTSELQSHSDLVCRLL